MQIYLQDAPELLLDIKEAVRQNDNLLLAQKAHALKGITAYYTKGAAYEACLNLEMMGRAEKLAVEKKLLEDELELAQKLILGLIADMNIFIAKNSSLS